MKKRAFWALLWVLLLALTTAPVLAGITTSPVIVTFTQEDDQHRKTRIDFSDGTYLLATGFNEDFGSQSPMSQFRFNQWSGYGKPVQVTVPAGYELTGAETMQVVSGETELGSDGTSPYRRAFAGATVILQDGFSLFYKGGDGPHGGGDEEEPPAWEETLTGSAGDDLTWMLDVASGVMTISGTGEMYDSERLEFKTTEVWEKIRSVVIGDEVTSIGRGAFSDPRGLGILTSITIGSSVEKIGDYAFQNNTGITSLTIPDSVTTLGTGAIAYNSGLTELRVGAGLVHIGSGNFSLTPIQTLYLNMEHVPDCFFGLPIQELTLGERFRTAQEGAFRGCSSLHTVTILGSPAEIAPAMFAQCSNLKGITLPDSVRTIGAGAFSYAGLTGIDLSHVEEIGDHAFTHCIALSQVTLSPELRTIGAYGFSETTRLKGIELPQGLTGVGEAAFGWSGLEELLLPDGITSLGADAFYACEGLTSAVVGSGVRELPSGLFAGCTRLRSVDLPDQLTTIGELAFSSCTGLSQISIPYGVGTVGAAAFAYSGLTSAVIPDSVTTLGEQAFEGCSALEEVELGTGLTAIQDGTFSNTPLARITVPDNIVQISDTAFDIPFLLGGAPTMRCHLYDAAMLPALERTVAYQFAMEHDFPTELMGMGAFEGTFDEAGWQKDLVIAWKIDTDTGELTLDGTGRENFYGEESDVDWFIPAVPRGSGTVEGATWTDFAPYVKVLRSDKPIGRAAFANREDDALGALYRNLSRVRISSDVYGIGDQAFSSCDSLREVVIDDPVSGSEMHSTLEIAAEAFRNCSQLSYIRIPAIFASIHSSAFRDSPGTVIYCYENSAAHQYAQTQGIPFVLLNPLQITSFGYPGEYALTHIQEVDGVTTYCFAFAYQVETAVIDLTVTEGADWRLYEDAACTREIPDKRVELTLGLNPYYIRITRDGKSAVYGLTYVRKEYEPPTVDKQYVRLQYNQDCDSGMVNVRWDGYLFRGSAGYNKDLALTAAALNAAAGNSTSDGKSPSYYLVKDLEQMGFQNKALFNYYDYQDNVVLDETKGVVEIKDDGPYKYPVGEHAFAIAHRWMTNDEGTFPVVAIVLRGTEVWEEIKNDGFTSAGQDFYGYKVHGYFLRYMERVWAGLRYYADLHPEIKTGDVRFLITGHSLGGAAANLLAAKMTLIQERGTGEWEAMGWSVPPAQRNIYAFTFGSLNAFDRHYDTSRFTHIKNIFNYYDTYGPNGDGFLGLVYPASGGKSCLYKFGPVLVFQKRYEGQFKTDDYCNHLMPGYLDAIRTDAVSRAALRNGLRLIIACPVDVEVYNSQGTLIGAIRDDVVDGTLAPYHAFVHQGAKYLYMPQDEDLRFRMIATGEGEMEFLAQPFGSVEGGGEEGYTLFRHVALTPGKVLFSQVGDPVPVEQVELFVQDEAGNFTAQVLTDGQEVPVAQKPSGGGGGGGTSSTHAVVLRAGEGGSLSVHPGTAAEGDMVTITPAAEAGYEVGSLTVIDSRGNALELHSLGDGRFTFRMPGTQVTVTASFAKRSALPFADVSEEDWFHPAVTYVWRAGLMSGTSPERFAPRETLTRGMIAQILYAWEGKPEEMGTGAFADVSAGAWYAPGVNWAQANGIVAGMGGGRFAPDSPLTREQLAAILYRYAQYKGWDVRPGANASLTAYGDADRISAYAVPALEWACGSGLISGRGDGILAPADTATRAETAQILMGLMERHAA